MKYAEQQLSELAIAFPMATEIFRKNRLDFCCGGKQTLKEACERKNLDLQTIEAQLDALAPQSSSGKESLNLAQLSDHIVERYHEDLRRRLPELLALAQKVERVHGDHPSCPRGLFQFLSQVHSNILMHMMKEENVLFPMIKQGVGHMAIMPIKIMNGEHDTHGLELEEIRKLTSHFTPPEGACGTWRALYAGLEKFEAELMEHIHLENNVLFPRALGQRS